MGQVYDVVIIGGGPAGCAAALYAARAGLDAVILERMSVGGQMALSGVIENYPGFEEGIDGFTLGMRMQAAAERFGARTRYAEVLSLNPEGAVKRIETSEGPMEARAVIIATGANPRELGVAGERELLGRGVHYCAHCDGRFYKGRTVAVVGGGDTAVSDALHLSRIAERVFLIHRRDALRATRIYHDPLMRAENVRILWNSEVSGLRYGERLTAVSLTDTRTGGRSELPCDALFVSIGRVPATGFLAGGPVRLDRSGYVVADESATTNVPGVFVAGDARTKALRQVVTAAADGAMAALAAEEYLGLRAPRTAGG